MGGQYKDIEKRKEYMRVYLKNYMKKKRAKARLEKNIKILEDKGYKVIRPKVDDSSNIKNCT